MYIAQIKSNKADGDFFNWFITTEHSAGMNWDLAEKKENITSEFDMKSKDCPSPKQCSVYKNKRYNKKRKQKNWVTMNQKIKKLLSNPSNKNKTLNYKLQYYI